MNGKEFQELADKLPADVHWGDPLTPEIVSALAQSTQSESTDPNLRKAVFTVLEGSTLPDWVRKILETAYYSSTLPTEVLKPKNEQKKSNASN
jgi:hypothetical protein